MQIHYFITACKGGPNVAVSPMDGAVIASVCEQVQWMVQLLYAWHYIFSVYVAC